MSKPPIQPLIEAMFAVVSAKNVDAVTAAMADHAEFCDPHYPYPTMRGASEVRAGLAWAFSGMKSIVIDTDGTKITKVRAYEPYGPGGSVGFGLSIGHTIYRMTHRRK